MREAGTRYCGIDANLDAEMVGASPDRHHGLFERGVAGALTQTVNRALNLPRAGTDSGQRVGSGQTKVVVAVDRDHHVVRAGNVLQDALDEARKLVGNRVADGIGNVDRGRAGLDHFTQHSPHEINIGAGRIHRRELDVTDIALGPGDHLASLLQDGLAVLAQLVRNVNVGRREEDVNARVLTVADRLPALVDIVGHGPAERSDLGAANFAGNPVDGVEVGRRGGGEAGLMQSTPSVRAAWQSAASRRRRRKRRRPVAVAQRRIKDSDSVSHSGNSCGSEQRFAGKKDVAARTRNGAAALHQATSTPQRESPADQLPSLHTSPCPAV